MKTCNRCGETKPSVDFNRAQQNADGLKAVCRACQGAYYQANREREKARSVARYAANHERLAVEAAAYRAQHPDRVVAARAKYLAVNSDRLAGERAAARDLTRQRRQAERAVRDALPPPDVKRCPMCGESKPASEFFRCPQARSRLQSRCKACQNDYSLAWKLEHPDRAKAWVARYHVTHREQVAARVSAYRADHLDEYRARALAWKAANPDRVMAAYKARYAANAPQCRAYARAYAALNPEVAKRGYHLRRARKLGAAIFGRVAFKEVRRRDRDICWLCGGAVTEKTLSFDHAIPLSKGGEHSTRNIRVAHRACNSAKRARLVTHQRFLL